ncbi:hypothetical protein OU997_14785 [Pseudomonas sp. SL4(2022)]|uniref:hypothetical protein n=1 Tax=unclassified Pseudomonas TaxID=196821 RepID=UPI0011B2458B|nr:MULTISPECIES: hypothetical protein [unclassified Pseudomonas]WAC43524.1 hypothetical protein OU997_14785 [Pseudomonas sp. SL4(2022)]
MSAYAAWSERDLETCPFHEYLRTRNAKHSLICADGSARAVEKVTLAGVDWQRVMEIGLFIQVVSALLSFGNIPARIRLTHTQIQPIALDETRNILLKALAQRPHLYTQRRSQGAVQSSLKRARSVADLAASIASEPKP